MLSGSLGRSSVSKMQSLPKASRHEIHPKNSREKIFVPFSYLDSEL
jgi:hypothetical protein